MAQKDAFTLTCNPHPLTLALTPTIDPYHRPRPRPRYLILLLVLTGVVAAWGGTFTYNRIKLRRRKANDERFLKKSWKAQVMRYKTRHTKHKAPL